MTTLLVTTIRRHTPYTEPSGFMYAIDLEKAQVLQRCSVIEPPFRDVDTNPRGGLRGSRGIAVREDQIAISNASMVVRYDPQWNLLGVITHPCCAAIHDIMFQGDSLWVTAARIDLLMQFDLEGNLLRYYYLRDPSPALDALAWKPPILLDSLQIRDARIDFRDPRTHEEEVYDRAHVNSVIALPNGDLLVSLGLVLGTKFANLLRAKSRLVKWGIWPWLLAANRQARAAFGLKKDMHSDLIVQPAKGHSAVVHITPDGKHRLSLTLSEITVPSHSLMMLADETVIYLDTTKGSVVHFEPYADGVLSSTKVTDGFLRGVTQLQDQSFLMGSRGELLKFDLSTRRLVDKMKVTEDPNESVYDVKVLPPHFALPPLSVEEHFIKQAGFSADILIRDGYRLQKNYGK